MKFKLDENLSPALSGIFAAAGHEAHSIVEQSLGGESDERVANMLELLAPERLAGLLWGRVLL